VKRLIIFLPFLWILLTAGMYGGTDTLAPYGVDDLDWVGEVSTAGGEPPAHTDYTDYAGCQGAYLFASESETTDSSGEGNTLSCSNCPDYGTGDGLPNSLTSGQYAKFTDDNSDVLTRAHADLSTDFPGKKTNCYDMAAAVWFKASEETHYRCVMWKGNGSANGWELVLGWRDTSWNELAVIIGDTGWTGVVTPVGILADGAWHHIAFSFDGSENELKVWIDNSEHASSPFTLTDVDDICINADYSFDISSTYSDRFLDGYVYQPIVFDETFADVATGVSQTDDDAVVDEIYNYGIDGNG